MNSEKDFKDSLNGKLNEKQFHFDEANWEQASAMLDATRPEKKKRPFFYFTLSSILLFVSVITFFVLRQSNDISEKEIASKNSEIKTTETTNSQNINKEIAPTENLNTNSTSIENNAIAKTKNEIKKTVVEKVEKTIPTNQEIIVAGNINSTLVNKISKKEKKAVVIPAVAITPKTKNKKEITPKNNSEKVVTTTKTEKEEPVTKTIPEEVKTTSEKVEEVVATPVTINLEVVLSTTDVVNNATDSAKSVAVIAETPKKDSLPKPLIKEPIHFISFEAGATYLFGWNNPGKKDANGFNPTIGLNYSNVITKKVTFSIGIHYT
ncbi:MAG: hypothetical protein LH615_02315, partial [Ferruginibacter sp.]|nr:hypothetical protein [Ferruginibacter sp.]